MVDEIKMDRAKFNKEWFGWYVRGLPLSRCIAHLTRPQTTRSRHIHAVRHSRAAHHHTVRDPAVEVNVFNSLSLGTVLSALAVITCIRASWLSRSRLTAFPPAYALGSPSLASDSAALVNRLSWVRLFAELSWVYRI